MSAFRFQQQLVDEGFLDEHAPVLRLVRVQELLRQWQAVYLRPPRDFRMRWLLHSRDPLAQLHEAIARYENGRKDEHPRACVGLFAAAESLGVGFVQGIPPHLNMERIVPGAITRIGLGPATPGTQPAVFVRAPKAAESVFRGAVNRDGVAVSDILQVWLDVSHYPARGAEQAEEIRRTALPDLFRS
jgi:hypothetical protein